MTARDIIDKKLSQYVELIAKLNKEGSGAADNLKDLDDDQLWAYAGAAQDRSDELVNVYNSLLTDDSITKIMLEQNIKMYSAVEAIDEALSFNKVYDTISKVIGLATDAKKTVIKEVADNAGKGGTYLLQETLKKHYKDLPESFAKDVNKLVKTYTIGASVENYVNADEIAQSVLDVKGELIKTLDQTIKRKQKALNEYKIEWNRRDLGPWPSSKYAEMNLSDMISSISNSIKNTKTNITI